MLNKLSFLILSSILLSAAARSEGRLADIGVMKAVINDLIIAPALETVSQEAKGRNRIELIIVEDASLREALKNEYRDFSQWLMFDETKSVIVGGGAYVHRGSGRIAFVNRLKMISEADGYIQVEWKRDSSSQGGTMKRFKLISIRGRWSIIDVELMTVA